MMTITIKDETSAGKILQELNLDFAAETVTLKEIITSRVLQEVEAYNRRLPEYFHGLVKPSESEKTLNGYRLKPKAKIDGEKQVYTALDAFQKNGFFVLIDDLQAEELDQEVLLKKGTTVSFIKLTQLVGG